LRKRGLNDQSRPAAGFTSISQASLGRERRAPSPSPLPAHGDNAERHAAAGLQFTDQGNGTAVLSGTPQAPAARSADVHGHERAGSATQPFT